MTKKMSLEDIVILITDAQKLKIKNEYVDIQVVYQLVDALKASIGSGESLSKKYINEKAEHRITLDALTYSRGRYESTLMELNDLKKSLNNMNMYMGLFVEKFKKMNDSLDDTIIRKEINNIIKESDENFGKIFDMKI